ncbi:MAG: DNA-3-methyladenine glycosylase [Candidatus Bathyarchaeota archaeon]|nr:DNA-3-methyladenine glycosylase [Candidatus Bathyarchaeota archaeon]
MQSLEVLPRHFFERDPEIVAKELLGKRLIRKSGALSLEGIIVETEAYYGLSDPASRVFHGIKDFNRPMWEEPGRAFVYNVHRYWMFNIVAHEPDRIGAVLIRALEPTKGIEIMKRNRPVQNESNLTNGPGKLTIALKIDRSLNRVAVTSSKSDIIIANRKTMIEIGSSNRIGVKKDLNRKLRFYVKGNRFVSR